MKKDSLSLQCENRAAAFPAKHTTAVSVLRFSLNTFLQLMGYFCLHFDVHAHIFNTAVPVSSCALFYKRLCVGKYLFFFLSIVTLYTGGSEYNRRMKGNASSNVRG